MPSMFPVVFMLVITLLLMTASALSVPKGANQVTIRTGLMIGLFGCYMLWMITYMAQLHPLITPIRSAKA